MILALPFETYDQLFKWKNKDNGKTVLLVEGARRVGKSYIALEFAKNNYKTYIDIIFLISDINITSKHNIIPIEVKSGERYTYSSLNKLKSKYSDYLGDSIIIHTKDLKEENGILYVPVYMSELL